MAAVVLLDHGRRSAYLTHPQHSRLGRRHECDVAGFPPRIPLPCRELVLSDHGEDRAPGAGLVAGAYFEIVIYAVEPARNGRAVQIQARPYRAHNVLRHRGLGLGQPRCRPAAALRFDTMFPIVWRLSSSTASSELRLGAGDRGLALRSASSKRWAGL